MWRFYSQRIHQFLAGLPAAFFINITRGASVVRVIAEHNVHLNRKAEGESLFFAVFC
ncbi:Uncharacterised protein [Enterobacter cloacae]|nr:Uncharacterised protein [Enterobacter cloacae]